MSNPDLPEDHIIDILARLPVKSLLRCKSVCKPWRSRISNPRFIKMHMERAMMNPMNNTFIVHTFQTHDEPCFEPFSCRHDFGRPVLSLINPNSLNKSVELDIPFPTSTNERGFVVVGSWNGLLCIFNEPNELYLWNPATRQQKDIMNYTLEADILTDRIYLGFGFDHANSDFKVVRIVTNRLSFPLASRVEVYSLHENSWKEIEVDLRFKIIQRPSKAIAKGLPYWLAQDISDPKRFILVSFDVHSEKFCEISLPDDIMAQGTLIMMLEFMIFEFMESVAIIAWDKYSNVEIWALDDESSGKSCWIKKINFTASPVIHWPVGCLKTGEFLVQTSSNELLVLYDPGNPLFKLTQIQTLNLKAYNYFESLVSLN